ncbi:MAG: nucleoside kinase [Clostridia bacterium]|nr:nucleoside kinase [Clostridia bacterium]
MEIIYKNQKIQTKENEKISKILEEEIKNNRLPVVGAIFNNEYKNLDEQIDKDGTLELIDVSHKEGSKIYRRTLVYIMGKAFEELYPELKVSVDYQLGHSMFCDVVDNDVTSEMVEKLRNKMKEIIEKDLKIEKIKMNREEAEKLYEENGFHRGMLQLDLKDNPEIYMYKCEDYYNYFYGEIANRTGVSQIFDLIKYDNGFLIRYMSVEEPDKLPEYKETKKLGWALEEYDSIHKILNVDTVYRLNKNVKEKTIKDVIMLAEALHEKKIANIADEIAKRKGVKIILIAGPSSSGKTTFAQRLGIQLMLNGIKPVTISVDNYFVERPDTPRTESGEYDFECIEAIDLKLFNEHLEKLLKGEEIEMPQFDFKVGTKRYNGNMMKLHENEVLVVEGIHCLNDRLTSTISKDQKYKIYISALTVLNMDRFNRISTTDTRLIRRMVRDYKFRGYSAKDTIQRWPTVNLGEQKNIFPFQESADSIFNTSLIYELGAFKNVAIPILEEIKPEEKEYAEAKRILNMLKYFEPIPEHLIPTNSLITEFLGGGDFKY